jgi:UDP-N-acetylmuramate--alanine ligase
VKHKVRKIHFVGIGGSGMSGIAEVLLTQDFEVSGSDLAASATTLRLEKMGAKVYQGHDGEHVIHADVVVTSTAVRQDNPEVLAAREHNIPIVPRAMMLAELMRFKQGIAVAGTHGKTTTTSLIASILAEAGMDPTFVIGGRLEAAGTNARLGSGEFLVAEADESDASFLLLSPILAVITNIDQDHMETYGHDFNRLKQAFVDFTSHLPFYGMAVVCIDDPVVREILPRITKPVWTYGVSEDAKVRALNVQADNGQMRFTVERRNGNISTLDITLNLPGMHYVLNALAAIAIATEVGASDAAIVKALAEFKGVGRRFERYGEIEFLTHSPTAPPSPLYTRQGEPSPGGGGGNGKGRFTLIDDYGHHPVEMEATIAAARGAFPGRRLVLAFQPHRFTRTRDLFEDFARVLSSVDALLLTEVYAAGEAPIVAADGRALARAVRVTGKVEPIFVENVTDLPSSILAMAKDGDVVLVMGAGSIGQVAGKLARGEV